MEKNDKSSQFSRTIEIPLYLFTVFNSYCLYIMSLISDSKTESEPVDFVKALEPTEVSQKYGYLDSVLKLEEEINRNVELLSKISESADEADEIRVVIGIELSKAKMLKKGKLKMFHDLCLVALKEIPPIEGDKEVTVDDLDGFWCLLGLEADKHRQAVIEIMNPKPIIGSDNDRMKSCCDTGGDSAPIIISKTTSAKTIKSKKSVIETKEAAKVSKSNIQERNRKYMERMKRLKELKAKPDVKVQVDKENVNPDTPIREKKDTLKPRHHVDVLSPNRRVPVQW